MTDTRTITLRFAVDIEVAVVDGRISLDGVRGAALANLATQLEKLCLPGRTLLVSPGTVTLTLASMPGVGATLSEAGRGFSFLPAVLAAFHVKPVGPRGLECREIIIDELSEKAP